MEHRQLRLAKPEDAKQLADLHWTCSADQPGGFMFQLGKRFLVEYYRVCLNERTSVILCVENAKSNIIGLVSGSLAAEEHMAALPQNKLRLAVSAVPSIVRAPRLLGSMYARQGAGSAEGDKGGYIVTVGPREEFWAWDPSERSAGGAIELHKKWLSLMHLLGASQVKLEVDQVNTRVVKMHELMGATRVREFSTPDGRQRLIMEYALDGYTTTQRRQDSPAYTKRVV